MLRNLQAALKNLRALGVGKREAAWLAGTAVGYAVLEGVGVGLLVPMLQYVERGDTAFEQGTPSMVWRVILGITSALGIRPTLFVLLTLVFVTIVARQVVRYLHQLAVVRARVRATAVLRQQGIESFLRTDLPFIVSVGQGRLLSALTSEAERAGTALTHLLNLWASGTLLVVYLVLLFAMSPLVAPVALLAMGAVAVLVHRLIEKSRELGVRVTAIHDELHAAFTERLAGIRLVKMMGQEKADAQRVNSIIERLSDVFIGIGKGREAIEVSVEPLLMLGAFLTLYVAVVSFGLTLASLGIFLFIFLRILPLLKQVNIARQQVGAHIAGFLQTQQLIERSRTATLIVGGSRPFEGLRECLEFRQVGFSYFDNASEGWALRDISFRVKKGMLTAIVGRSGAGKSTLLDLIPRLREATTGAILLDGVPIHAFELRSLRARIGIVDQHGFLFNDTVRNNLTYGLAEKNQGAIEEAARKAYAHAFVQALPEGYDTVLGDRGVRLSGGQRQRLALARVFLQDPDILLLDEPTSALDSESEQFIQAAIEELRKEKLIIVIAHRLSTIRQADRILVLDEGCIVEQGDHGTLLNRQGAYHRLFELQLYA
jgi:ABC-type multidrug transport system fused ATPase/permease subunit